MTFLNPLFLLGTLAVSVPIAIHLLSRLRPRPMDFGAMELLRRALVTRSRQVKLEDLLLLLLRCLAILLLALVIARPTLTGAGAQLTGRAGQAAVIALDGSMSMGHAPGLHSRFDRGVERVRTILETLDPGARLTLLLLGDTPEVLHEGRYDPQQMETLLDQLRPQPQRLNVERSLEAIAAHVERLESGTPEVYLVSDMQAQHFAEPSATARDRMAELGETSMLMLTPVGDERHENLAIESLAFTSGSLRVGEQARYRATVRNTGSEPRQDVTVQLLRDEVVVASAIIDVVEPGSTAHASFLLPLEDAGTYRLAARLEQDELAADNIAYSVAQVRDRTRVLVVSGLSSDGHWSQSAGGFVVRALQPRGPAIDERATLDVRQVDWMDLAVQNLGDYEVVVLADVPDVAGPQVQRLRQFVDGGGGLVLLAGDQTDPVLFNARLAGSDTPLAPARLIEQREISAGDEDGAPLYVARPDHPLGRPLALLPTDLLDEARVRRYWQVEPTDAAQVILTLPESQSASDSAPAQPAPLLIERDTGRGRVLLLTSAADREWGAWVIHPAWPILWHQTLTHLTQPVAVEGHVGRALVVALDAAAEPQQVRFVGPDGEETSLRPQARGDRFQAELARPNEPGFYEVYVDHDDDGATPPAEVMVRAVNIDTRESDVRVVGYEALASAWPEVAESIVGPDRELTEAIREARVGVELWWPLLLLALAVLVVESVLARRFTARMGGDESAPARRRLHVARWVGRRLTVRQAA